MRTLLLFTLFFSLSSYAASVAVRNNTGSCDATCSASDLLQAPAPIKQTGKSLNIGGVDVTQACNMSDGGYYTGNMTKNTNITYFENNTSVAKTQSSNNSCKCYAVANAKKYSQTCPTGYTGYKEITQDWTCSSSSQGTFLDRLSQDNCVVPCDPSTETISASCPSGYVGAASQSRTSTCAKDGPVWSAWSTNYAGCSISVPTGQVIITTQGYSTFTVPAGVTSISAVVVSSSHFLYNRITQITLDNGAIVLRAQNDNNLGDGGGYGGDAGTPGLNPGYYSSGGGGGGAGGYLGNGGAGASTDPNGSISGYRVTTSGASADAGSGGGGGGSVGAVVPNTSPPARNGSGGGGVGIYGIGVTGGASPGPSDAGFGDGTATGGKPGSGGTAGISQTTFAQYPPGGTYGGGIGGFAYGAAAYRGSRGGALAWRNNIPVVPGSTLYLLMETGSMLSANGVIRIIWGNGRSFPYNAK